MKGIVPTANTVKKAATSVATGTIAGTSAGVQDGLSLPVALAIGLAIALVVFLVWKFKPRPIEHDVPVVPVTPTHDDIATAKPDVVEVKS